jgi:hypothetical protein
VPLRFSGQSIIKSDNKGDIYCLRFKFEESKETQEILKCDPLLQPIRKITSFEKPYKRRVVNPYPEGILACVMKDDNLIWGLSSAYEMNIVDPNGKTLRRIVKDHDPVKITAADKQRFLERESSGSGPLRFEYEFPEYYPAVNLLLVDDLNRIYVRTYEKDGQGHIAHDVFNPDGRYVARFFLPENERATIVKKNKLYCMIRESEEGIPLVKRYAIEWK